jgi:hypothetical protein
MESGSGSDARDWLTVRIADAPDPLKERMLEGLAEVDGVGPIYDQLADAAAICLRSAMAEQALRVCAMGLLAADALLTHACEAAAEAGGDELAAFAAGWNPERFEQLLHADAP